MQLKHWFPKTVIQKSGEKTNPFTATSGFPRPQGLIAWNKLDSQACNICRCKTHTRFKEKKGGSFFHPGIEDLTNGPRCVSCDRVMRYLGFFSGSVASPWVRFRSLARWIRKMGKTPNLRAKKGGWNTHRLKVEEVFGGRDMCFFCFWQCALCQTDWLNILYIKYYI